MSREKLEVLTDRLIENLARVKFGEVAVMLKVHDGRVVVVTYSVTENSREVKA